MASTMRNMGDDVEVLVVSKTGKYGRKNILANKISEQYGLSIRSLSYKDFYTISAKYSEHVIIHHRLECTRELEFINKPKLYLVINHTIQSLKRLLKFPHANVIVSVCKYLHDKSPKLTVPHRYILNGLIKNNVVVEKNNNFVTGRCHRLPSGKFSLNSLSFLDSLGIKNMVHYLAGPEVLGIRRYLRGHPNSCVKYLGTLQDDEYKRKLIKSFDLYFYDTYGPEGASAAILEALSAGVPVLCKPLGGNKELVQNGTNGYHYNSFSQAKKIILDLYHNPDKLNKLKEKTRIDFDNRLSMEKCVMKYKTLVEEFRC